MLMELVGIKISGTFAKTAIALDHIVLLPLRYHAAAAADIYTALLT